MSIAVFDALRHMTIHYEWSSCEIVKASIHPEDIAVIVMQVLAWLAIHETF